MDLEAAEGSLIRAHAQQTAGLDDTVKPGPEVPEGVVDEAADRCHRRDVVIDPSKHGRDVRLELIVSLRLRDRP
jgi:hypothetical protein